MMFPSPPFRKFVQTSEETLPSVHAPLILGNDVYILTQLDVRKIEDTRFFNISKVMPNGDLRTMNYQDADIWFQQLQKQEHLLCNQNLQNLLEFFISKGNCYRECQQQAMSQSQGNYLVNGITPVQPMEVSTTANENHTTASIEQQLQWNKCENSLPPFPMNYSQGTSTTDVGYEERNTSTFRCCKRCQQCGNLKTVCDKSTNTELQNKCSRKTNQVLDARQQLKKKKLKYIF